MQNFEKQYLNLMSKILKKGSLKTTRNGTTKSLFGEMLKISKEEYVPLLQSRKVFYKGVVAEIAAMMRGPKNVKDFEDQGCKFWKLWSDQDTGDMRLSYGNEWKDWGSSAGNPTGINQWFEIVKLAKENIYNRRLVMSGWNPDAIKNGNLSLECCHLMYIWNIETKDGIHYLNMSWHQRSADLAIGTPSNFINAYLLNLLMKSLLKQNGINVELGDITMFLADVHLYEEHWETAKHQCSFKHRIKFINSKKVKATLPADFFEKDIFEFNPNDFEVVEYSPKTIIKYLLKA